MNALKLSRFFILILFCGSSVAQGTANSLRENGTKAVAANERGVLLVKSGRYGEAAEEFELAISLDPKLAIARNNLGATYNSLGPPRGSNHDTESGVTASARLR